MSATARYNKFMGYGPQDVRMCENCRVNRMVHVHHVEIKGMGGVSAKENPDNPEETIGLCLDCHEQAHSRNWLVMRDVFRALCAARNRYIKTRKKRP